MKYGNLCMFSSLLALSILPGSLGHHLASVTVRPVTVGEKIDMPSRGDARHEKTSGFPLSPRYVLHRKRGSSIDAMPIYARSEADSSNIDMDNEDMNDDYSAGINYSGDISDIGTQGAGTV